MGLYCAKDGSFTGGFSRDPQGFFMSGLESRRKRALYRAHHRGTKELDLILGRYAEERVPTMDEPRLAAFEQFLALPDPDIDYWVRGGEAPDGVAAAVSDLRRFLGLMDTNGTSRREPPR